MLGTVVEAGNMDGLRKYQRCEGLQGSVRWSRQDGNPRHKSSKAGDKGDLKTRGGNGSFWELQLGENDSSISCWWQVE